MLVAFLVILGCFPLVSQEDNAIRDTLSVMQDTIPPLSVTRNLKRISANFIDMQVIYDCEGVKINDLVNKRAILIDKAKVKYGETEITADSIVFNMESNTVFAVGRRDSAGTITGSPVFRDGTQEYEVQELIYNFRTKQAIARNIVTRQDEGYLRSQVTKLLEDGTSNLSRSTYSTCDAEVPHFYISLPRAKIYPGKKIISGPGNLVLEGIPLPIAIPFGFFPIQTRRAASGILIPRVGQEQQRGYNLTEGGYYFALSEYFDLSLKGNIYTNGTWMLTAATNYNRLYRYSGNFQFSYANNVTGHKGLPDYRKNTNYRVGWTYTQSPKASPGSRFSASVNMSSSGFDRSNSYVVTEHVTTQRQSSISYSKNWEGTPFNLSASMNHSQNVKNKTVSLNLPKVSFNAARIYPFRGRSVRSTGKWYQELQLQYSASLDNQINTYDSLLFRRDVFNNMRSGFKHEIPLSVQFRPFRNFAISPQMSYTGVLYTQKITKTWNPAYFNEEINRVEPKVMIDTARGFFYGHALNPSVSASFNPQVFGTYTFINPDSRIQAIRHVMKPMVSFNYTPSLKGFSSDLYRKVQTDTLGRIAEYSVFEGSVYGTPSLPRRSSGINFSITNILEAKVLQKNDTTGKATKVSLIENFGISTSYNIFADSMRWSPVTFVMRTRIMNNFNISAGSNFSLYALDKNGRQTGTFLFTSERKLMRLNTFNVSLDFNVAELFKGKGGRGASGPAQPPVPGGSDQMPGPGSGQLSQAGPGATLTDEYGYPVFDVPWTLSVRYNLNYTKSLLQPAITQTLSFNGTLSLTKKMNIVYTSGYDFRMKEITMTQIGISRDLHCWDMSFNWVPNGSMKMWNFTIRVKAAILSDLKYERRKDFNDQYY